MLFCVTQISQNGARQQIFADYGDTIALSVLDMHVVLTDPPASAASASPQYSQASKSLQTTAYYDHLSSISSSFLAVKEHCTKLPLTIFIPL